MNMHCNARLGFRTYVVSFVQLKHRFQRAFVSAELHRVLSAADLRSRLDQLISRRDERAPQRAVAKERAEVAARGARTADSYNATSRVALATADARLAADRGVLTRMYAEPETPDMLVVKNSDAYKALIAEVTRLVLPKLAQLFPKKQLGVDFRFALPTMRGNQLYKALIVLHWRVLNSSSFFFFFADFDPLAVDANVCF